MKVQLFLQNIFIDDFYRNYLFVISQTYIHTYISHQTLTGAFEVRKEHVREIYVYKLKQNDLGEYYIVYELVGRSD